MTMGKNKFRYLIITEDQKIFKKSKITEQDKEEANDGFITIINCVEMREFYMDKWIDIEEDK